MSSPITVIARWRPVDGALEQLMAILAELQPQSLAEPGCMAYEIYQGTDPAPSILLVERYRDQAAIDAHRQSVHYQSLVVERALPLLAERRVDLLQAYSV